MFVWGGAVYICLKSPCEGMLGLCPISLLNSPIYFSVVCFFFFCWNDIASPSFQISDISKLFSSETQSKKL